MTSFFLTTPITQAIPIVSNYGERSSFFLQKSLRLTFVFAKVIRCMHLHGMWQVICLLRKIIWRLVFHLMKHYMATEQKL